MELKKVEIEVTKEAHELGQAVAALVMSVHQALKDGFQPGQDIPAVVMTAFAQLPVALDGVDKLGDEAKENVKSFVLALTLPLADAVESIVMKKA